MGCANIAAQIHANMCNDDRFGYSWEERYGCDDEVTWIIEGRPYTINLGDYECGTSVKTAWATALQGTPYEGCLDDYIYSGNCRAVFEGSGLFYSSYDNAVRGDVYLNDENHVAMCQDGGYDGVFGYDCLSEFCWGDNGAYGNQRGDQSGYEAYIHGFYEYPWNATLHYNGKADAYLEEVKPVKQEPGNAVNNEGLRIQAHVQNLGWCDWVHDGQVAGTTGGGLRLEALRVDPPEGYELRIKLHIQNKGWVCYTGIVHGNDLVLGTTGQSLRIEAIIVEVVKRPANSRKMLYFRVHQQDVGWKGWTAEGFCSGSDAEAMRLEAVQMKIE